MPTEPKRLLLAARCRSLPPLEPPTVALLPLPNAVRRPPPGALLAAARPDACPIRNASISEARIDGSVPPDDLARTVAECSRILAGEGRLEAVVRVRQGSLGILRALVAWIFHLPPPPHPESVARLLFDHGFDRIEQHIHGGLGTFRARRLPGRT